MAERLQYINMPLFCFLLSVFFGVNLRMVIFTQSLQVGIVKANLLHFLNRVSVAYFRFVVYFGCRGCFPLFKAHFTKGMFH